MSLLQKLTEKLTSASESGEMKKIRMEAEKRRASKSSASMPKVEGDVIDMTISSLANRIKGK